MLFTKREGPVGFSEFRSQIGEGPVGFSKFSVTNREGTDRLFGHIFTDIGKQPIGFSVTHIGKDPVGFLITNIGTDSQI